MTQTLATLSTDQIKTVFAAAGMATGLKRNGNAYNLIRAGRINEAVGTIKPGCSAGSHKKARQALRKALRDQGIEI